jgi:hypothetical protein
MRTVTATLEYGAAGGESFAAMQAEAAALTEKHTSAIQKQAAALARLAAMRDAGMIDGRTFAQANPNNQAVWSDLERKGRDNDDVAARIRASRELALVTRTALFDDANALNAKHVAPLERLNQAKLKLNALNATGALTQRAYNAELKAANVLYAQQATVMGRLGLTGAGLKSAAGAFINPWFVVAGALAMGAKEAMQFETAMDRVLALTGASASVMDDLSASARALGRDTIFSAREAAEAMSELAKAGITRTTSWKACPRS